MSRAKDDLISYRIQRAHDTLQVAKHLAEDAEQFVVVITLLAKQ